MSYCTIMDYAAAKLLLNELIGHILIEWWWLFHQKEEDELGIAKTLDHHLDTIEGSSCQCGNRQGDCPELQQCRLLWHLTTEPWLIRLYVGYSIYPCNNDWPRHLCNNSCWGFYSTMVVKACTQQGRPWHIRHLRNNDRNKVGNGIYCIHSCRRQLLHNNSQDGFHLTMSEVASMQQCQCWMAFFDSGWHAHSKRFGVGVEPRGVTHDIFTKANIPSLSPPSTTQ